MISSGFRKLAAEHNMKTAHGVAYGPLKGYCATFSEGSGYKQIMLSTTFSEVTQRASLQVRLNQQSGYMSKTFRVQNFAVSENRIQIVFRDTLGTMKYIRAFIDWFFPILDEAGASKLDVCSECGMQLLDGRWILVDGVAIYAHAACGQRLKETLQIQTEEIRKEGSYASGAVGAFLGATLGSVAWAAVMLLGYITSLIGLLIGFLSSKGYDLLKGKKGPGKLVILILSVIFGVLLGNISSILITLIRELSDYGISLSLKDAWDLLVISVKEDPEVRSALIKDTLTGLFFAALGVVGLVMNTKNEISAPKYVELS